MSREAVIFGPSGRAVCLQDEVVNRDGQLMNAMRAVVSKTAAYTATSTDYLITCDATSATFQVTLPALGSTVTGREYCVKKIDAGGNAVTVDGDGTENIDGGSVSLAAQYDSVTVIAGASEWHIVD